MIWNKVLIGEFLEERKDRFKPEEANSLKLKRISKIDFSGNIHLDENKPTKTNMILIKNGDLVISGINADKGAVAIYTGREDVMATIHYSSYSFDSSKINIDYLKWFLKSQTFLKILKEQSKGGIKTELKAKKLLPLVIDLPNLSGQKKILEKINSINVECNELCNLQSELLLEIDNLKQSILQEAIQGKLTQEWREQNLGLEPASELLDRIKAEKKQLIKDKKVRKGRKQKSNDLGNIKPIIPDSWIYADLDDISQFVTDGTHQTPTYTTKGRIFLSAQNVKPFKFMPEGHKYVSEKTFLEISKGKKTEKGDLLIGRVGSKGETAVIDRDLDFAFYVSLGFVKTFKNYTSPDYLAIVLNSPYGNLYATGNMSSIGASAGNFNLGRIRSFPIPFPSLEEQKVIVEKVEALMEKCNALEQEIIQSEEYANMLMQAVLKEAFEREVVI